MIFKRISPPEELKNIVECYWIAENSDPSPVQEKIIPDGFPEIIFHYGDPYLIRLKTSWEEQSKTLFAGQISKYFYLKNTGISGVIGIKLKPTALTHLYRISMDAFTDKVVELTEIPEMNAALMEKKLFPHTDHNEMVSELNQYFQALAQRYDYSPADKAIEMIFEAKGMLSVSALTSVLYITERQLERIFKNYIGLSPKFYCRIIRFNYIFQCMQNESTTWADIVHQAGFYDQSHFIRNFKAFTGEEPSSYLFKKNNLANFFLNKKD